MSFINQADIKYLQIIEDLHKNWTPHAGQLSVGSKFFNGNSMRTIFLQCGRKWGKSEFVIYFLWRHALLNPGSSCYYFAPLLKQAREIVWSERRLQNFGSRSYIAKIDNNELRITFTNGSFIKVDGSDSYEAHRGTQPSIAVYDEFKDFHPQFHEAMAPNLMVKRAPLLIIGTPPRIDDRNYVQYTQLADECKTRIDTIWLCRPSHDNPINDVAWLDNEKEKLFARGEPDVWYREYEAKIVAGGKRAVFPMINRDLHIRKHSDVMREISNDKRKLEWFLALDPGTTTCFAVLFGAINPFTKKIYLLDCIYETSQQETSIMKMYPKIQSKIKDLYATSDIVDDWQKVVDEAAAWANNEFMSQYGIYFNPTSKSKNKKEDGISLIKDILLNNMISISDKCEPLLFEMENYISDDFGKLPKKNDHLIDCFRYLLGIACYNVNEMFEAKRRVSPTEMVKMSRDKDLYENENDWTSKFEEKDVW